MNKAEQQDRDELRNEYKQSDFSGPFVRGKYVKRISESTNIVALRPEVAEVFQNEEEVNNALLTLIEIAQKSTGFTKPSIEGTTNEETGS